MYCRVLLIGHLGGDPVEFRYGTGNKYIGADFSIAVQDRSVIQGITGGKKGYRRKHTEWHDVKVFHRWAEIALKYLFKGRLVMVEGRLRSKVVQAHSGLRLKSYVVLGENFQMLDFKKRDDKGDVRERKSPAGAAWATRGLLDLPEGVDEVAEARTRYRDGDDEGWERKDYKPPGGDEATPNDGPVDGGPVFNELEEYTVTAPDEYVEQASGELVGVVTVPKRRRGRPPKARPVEQPLPPADEGTNDE